MSHSEAEPEYASHVDSTVRFKWELTKEKYDSCEFMDCISSHNYIVQLGEQTSEWCITICPKGDVEENKSSVYLELMKGDDVYEVVFSFGVQTDSGYWPDGDLVEKLYSNRKVSGKDRKGLHYIFDLEDDNDIWGLEKFSTTEEFGNKFFQNKLTFVVTVVFHMESKNYLEQKEVADDFVSDIRSLSLQENLSDVTIICSGQKFSSHKVLLAARSKYFEALFRHEKHKNEVNIDEASPEVVGALLDFVSKGLIPSDIDDKAVDLLELADMYQIELLSQVCLNSMLDNLSLDNALQTLITVDKLKHICNTEQREKILTYIKKERSKIAKGENWDHFILSYPKLVTELFLYRS